MKFALLTRKLSIFYLMSCSFCSTNVLAADQSVRTALPPDVSPELPASLTRTGVSGAGITRMGISRPGISPGMPQIGIPRGDIYRLQAPVATRRNTFVPNPSRPLITPVANMPMGEQVTLQSRDISSAGRRWQSFSDYLTVAKGCDQIPLFLTFTNGPAPTQQFQDLRINLAGKLIATIKDFNGQAVLTRNLTGAIGVGDSLLTIQAFGPAGARFNWKFTTPKIIVTKVNPTTFAPTDKITIEGRNFSDKPGVTRVLIGDKPANIISAKSNLLEIKPPSGLTGGKTNLYVVVGSQKSAPVEVTLKGAPEIEGVNMISTAPGQPLTVTGKGFSPIAAENIVTIGSYPAEVVSATPTSLQVIVPLALDAISPSWDLPVKVKTNNMDSTDPYNKGSINIQSRVF